MTRTIRSLLMIALFALPGSSLAQPIPERRAVFEDNIDFYGGDLRAIFDTTLKACESACVGDNACAALTYNIGAAACFLKTGVERRDPYDGALSALIVAAGPDTLARAASRADDLAFLGQRRLDSARDLAVRAGLDYRGTLDAEAALADARRIAADRPAAARQLAGQAAAKADRSDMWLALSEYALAIRTDDFSERRRNRDEAVDAATNAYLRATGGAAQVPALLQLAKALETDGDGRLGIDALRLALDIQPREEVSVALQRLIGLYGFRITDTQVDSDAATPRVCLSFSEPLVVGAVDYASFVQLPQGDFAVTAEEQQLCVEGMEHGTHLALTLRAGLPARSGEVLERTIEQDFYVRDRAPSVRFPGRGYVLPRSAAAAIPIVSVNAAEVAVAIHAVPDGGLRAALRDNLVGSPLSGFDERTLASDLGTPVWTGSGDLQTTLNKDVTTALPIGEAVRDFQPGVYVMTARLPGTEDYETAATQWFIVTDLGLSALSGADGTHAFVRSLGGAAPQQGIELSLVARNGAALGTATTDATGYARFAAGLTRGQGGNAPALLTALGPDGDYAFLDLTEAALDLTDRGVEGRNAPPPVDVYLTTERGAYRPGETVFATVLARDTTAAAIPGLPLTAITLRPDGVEHDRQLLADAGAGGRAMALTLPDTAARGTWRLRIHADPEAPALASTTYLVEDFVPERIDYTATLADTALRVGATTALDIEARYLYGAPGADLTINGDLRLAPTNTLEAFPGYSFGPVDYVEPLFDSLASGQVTGPDGTARVLFTLPEPEVQDRPFTARLTLRLADSSGRPVERRLTADVAPAAPLIGVRPLFDDAVPEGGTAGFEVISLAPGGARAAMDGLRWEIARVRTDYQWYEVQGRWSYEPIVTRSRVADGTLSTLSDAPVRIEAPVDWGRYELTIAGTEGGYARTTYGFSAGWYAAAAGSETPDRLDVSLDAETYAPGDTARLRLEPRSPGEILITVLSDKLISRQSVQATDTTPIEVALPVTPEWGSGAYVVATHIRALDADAGRNPSRAIGTGWIGVDPGPRLLDASITSAPEAAPRSTHMAEIAVSGATPGEQVYATLAAVDLGILNLTGFDVPDPADHYHGQRRLGVELRDVYGRLIDGLQGSPGRLRSGGDGGSSGTKGPPPTEALMAQFSGVVTVDENGRVQVPIDLPDFNGTVRLNAIVWSETGVGNTSQELLVRDPIVLSANLPRFLAPGDSATLELDLAHVSGPAGAVSVSYGGTDALPLPDAADSVTLAEGGRARVSVPLAAGAVSDNRLTVTLTTPDGRALQKSLNVAIRANDPEVARQSRLSLAANGGELVLDRQLFSGLVPGTGQVMLSAGSLARFDVPGLLAALDAYPYGCTEQITSRALPLVYYDQLARGLALAGDSVAPRIDEAIETVLSRQGRNGGFGMWSAFGDDLWLSSYVTDFLSRARAQGHSVPDLAFASALDHLRNGVNAAPDFEDGGEDIAYALMVLAREGRASVGDLRYYADQKSEDFATPLALAQLGTALASYGDPGRADAMFAAAADRLRYAAEDTRGWRADFGSDIRDRAAILTLAVEAGSNAIDRAALSEAVARDALPGRGQSTQEQLWTVLAANALGGAGAPPGLMLDGVAPAGPLAARFTGADLSRPVTLANAGPAEVPVVLSVFGTPEAGEPAGGNGYRIERTLFTLEGALADPAALARNDRIVVMLTITPERPSEARLMVDDPLPAGLEIENPNLATSGDIAGIDWLDLPDVATFTEARTDRFLAAVDWSGDRSFRLAYVARAISPGSFHHPAASVEDMYRPAFRARTDAARVEIGPVR
ncbi:alpha-2-macroglobulin family protein [Oceanibium sediminis]|uniref:alpha-2-macroglobulin family protein n=1 Tax=Oceanibium sediminis TaxID=2026339 RepID=UPI000DD3A393|nr:alpha-2-macroglobulin family protein [Oceanibium sediminis]